MSEKAQLQCPMCTWRSATSIVLDQPNAWWYAFKALRPEYYEHFAWSHRPAPLRVKLDG